MPDLLVIRTTLRGPVNMADRLGVSTAGQAGRARVRPGIYERAAHPYTACLSPDPGAKPTTERANEGAAIKGSAQPGDPSPPVAGSGDQCQLPRNAAPPTSPISPPLVRPRVTSAACHFPLQATGWREWTKPGDEPPLAGPVALALRKCPRMMRYFHCELFCRLRAAASQLPEYPYQSPARPWKHWR